MKVNEGEIPQYYVEDSHEAIIPPDEWERVQKGFARRKALGRRYSGNGLLASRLVCGDCGGFFGSKVWNSTNEKYRKTIWQCNNKFKGEKKCATPHITETEIKEKFVQAFHQLFKVKYEIIENCEMIAKELTDCTDINKEREHIKDKLEVLGEMVNKYIKKNASQIQDQEEYQEKYNGYVAQHEQLSCELRKLDEQIMIKKGRMDLFKDFIRVLEKQKEPLPEFDNDVWMMTIDKVCVMPNKTLRFIFQNGAEISI